MVQKVYIINLLLKMKKMYKILIIEDEEITAIALETLLISLGYEVTDCVNSAKETYKSLEKEMPDLIISDVMIQGGVSGCELSKELYLKYKIPVIFLTAYCDDEILQYAIDTNACGYIVKPYKDYEIKATVKLALQNVLKIKQDKAFVKCEEYIFYIETKKIFKNGVEIKIGKKSVKLLEILIKNKNNTVSYEMLINEIWERDDEKNLNNLRQLVKRTKQKLGLSSLNSTKNIGYNLYIDT